MTNQELLDLPIIDYGKALPENHQETKRIRAWLKNKGKYPDFRYLRYGHEIGDETPRKCSITYFLEGLR